MPRPFHLALPTENITETKAFYTTVFGCQIGRSADTWIDFDFFGHQLVFHEYPGVKLSSITNPVDSKKVRVPHFGIIATMADWHTIKDKLIQLNTRFIIDPYTRFKGTNGEQSTLFFEDNNGYAIEIKAFASDEYIFKAFEDE